MQFKFNRILVFLTAVLSLASVANAGPSRPPFTGREVIALVAGDALSEDIILEINSRGLAFHPTDAYRGLVTTAGGAGDLFALQEDQAEQADKKERGIGYDIPKIRDAENVPLVCEPVARLTLRNSR